MDVTGTRTGIRRYGLEAEPPDLPAVEMNPAPSFDEHLLHDLVHFVVERELGIQLGLFGQLAPYVARVWAACTTGELERLDETVVDAICEELDRLSERWVRLSPGESMTVSWPEQPRSARRASSG